MHPIQLNNRLFPVVVLTLLLLQIFFPYKGWVTLLIALGGFWLIAYLWALALTRSLSFTRERRFGLAQVGDALEERFTVTNKGWIPAIWFELDDESTLPGYRVGRASGVGSGASLQWTTQGLCTRRGAFRLGPTTLRTGNPFGLYRVTIHHLAITSVFVLPPIVPLPAIRVSPGGRAGEGRPKRNAPERTVSVSTVRSYVPGDDRRWIHWPTTAKRNALHVRLFENTRAGDWWMYLDLDSASQVADTDEHAIILAASLIDQGIHDGHSVGMVTHGSSLMQLPPTGGSGGRLDLLRALALATPGSVPLSHLLTHARPPLRELASLILITPNITGDWIESLLPLIWRGAVPTILLLDPSTYGSQGGTAAVENTLAQLNCACYRITRDMLDRPEAQPGQQGRWQWRVSATGRASLAAQPGELEWKPIGV